VSALAATRSGSIDAFDVKIADYPRPHTGDILVSGQDVKNGPQAFNINQLVTAFRQMHHIRSRSAGDELARAYAVIAQPAVADFCRRVRRTATPSVLAFDTATSPS
jgi:hypothetical protein